MDDPAAKARATAATLANLQNIDLNFMVHLSVFAFSNTRPYQCMCIAKVSE
jgi:hypothetical protein